MYLEISSARWRPFCHSLNILTTCSYLNPGLLVVSVLSKKQQWWWCGVSAVGGNWSLLHWELIDYLFAHKSHDSLDQGLPRLQASSIEIRAWTCNHIHINLWDIITYPCPYLEFIDYLFAHRLQDSLPRLQAFSIEFRTCICNFIHIYIWEVIIHPCPYLNILSICLDTNNGTT